MSMKTRRVFTFAALSACIFLFAAGPARLGAQSGATIGGTIFDQTGKSIAGASVALKNDTASFSRAATSDADGHFSLTGLSAGTYSVETTAPGFALNVRRGVDPSATGSDSLSITMKVDAISNSVTVQETYLAAVETSPMSASLDDTAAHTEISNAVITNFMAPVADFAEVIQQAPGAFSVNPNGIGLGQGKSFFRSFPDGDYTITFDGIPFEDTNTPTHHSWASFPSQWISSADFDRSPGNASDFGPTNFGGSINLKSPELQADPDIRGTFSIGSFNTKLYSLDFESGLIGPKKQDAVLVNINAMTSDGYQTFNYQKRDAGYGKYQHRFSAKTSLSLYGGVVDIFNNTPDTTNATRAQIAQFGDNYLMDNTPLLPSGAPDPYYYGYEHYHVQTDFEYAHYTTDFGNGWKLDSNAYTTRYWNKQFLVKNFSIPFPISTSKPTGVDKLNGYRHAGDTLIISKESKWGIFRTGTWYDWAYTDRYQYPSNPVTQLDTPFPNFHEHFITQSFQPFAEYEWHPARRLVIITGIKAADYAMVLNQYQDNGKIVGCLGGKTSTDFATGAPTCLGGAQFVTHGQNWNNWLPSAAVRYRVWKQWSAYGQFGIGSIIPPSAAFDVPGGIVSTQLKPTTAKTYQAGTVLQLNKFSLDMDAYYVHFQNGYTSFYDPNALDTVFVATGPSNTKGFEAEGNYAIGHGLSLYANLTAGSAKYQTGPNFPNGGEWVANTPTNTEGVSLLYQHGNWDAGMVYKHVGQYWQDNGSLNYMINGASVPYPVNQAALIQPWDLVNVFFNYTLKDTSHFRGTKFQLAINNLANSHSLVGITPGVAATATTPYVQSPLDQLNLMPGRSVSLTITGGYAPKR